MDLPAPLSCFSRGFARLTSSLAKSVFCACANLCRAKNRSGHGRTGRSESVKHNKFLFKKRIMSTFLGLMLLLLAAITSPATTLTAQIFHRFQTTSRELSIVSDRNCRNQVSILRSIGIGGIDNCGIVSPSPTNS